MRSSASSSPSREAHGPLLQDEEKDYDEERLQRTSNNGTAPRWSLWSRKSSPRQPWPRKVKLWIFVIDIIILIITVHAFSPLISLLQRNEELFGARLAFSQGDQPPGGQQTIPRILHQTVANETIPEKWTLSQKSCKDTYSDFDYKLWTDASARQFLVDHYSWFVETFDNYPNGIQRADSLRYFVLHHYGGMYVDMDTLCTKQIPFSQLEADGEEHHAVFKSTTPTGVSNDLMITSAHHPVFDTALKRIQYFSDASKFWGLFSPYIAIMVSAGPMFITFAIKGYLLDNPGLAPTDVQVVNATQLAPYITDLEAASWHQGDAQTIMFLGERPWIWYTLGFIGFTICIYFINKIIVYTGRSMGLIADPSADSAKVAKLT